MVPAGIVRKPSEEDQREIWHRWIPPPSTTRHDVLMRSTALTAPPQNTADIVASGALIWRMRNGALEVLTIHRPRYDDWSWPKGQAGSGRVPG